MSILVTGATGHLGRLVLRSLGARGVPAADVIAAGRNTQWLQTIADLGFRTARVDYDDPESLRRAFDNITTLLLISGSEVGRRIPQHANVINSAKAAGVTRVAYTSIPDAQNTTNPLAPEHRITERTILDSGLQYTFLRNNWYTENYVPTLQQARESGVIVSAAGDGRVASAPRSDYADAAAVVISTDGHANRIYELSGDAAWDFHELAVVASRLLGRPVAYQPVSPEELVRQLKTKGMDEGTARFVASLDETRANGTLAKATRDLSGLIDRPTVPLEDALRAALS